MSMYDNKVAIQILSTLLYFASSKQCEFVVWDEAHQAKIEHPDITRDSRGDMLFAGDWYVIVTCENGHKYYINVSADSILTMCAEVLNFIQYK